MKWTVGTLRTLALVSLLGACGESHGESEGSPGSGPRGELPGAATPLPTPPAATAKAAPPTNNDAGVVAPPPDPGPPAVQLIGRFDKRDPAGPKCGWPGCRIVARFSGTSVSASFVEQPWDHGPSEWDVSIDGAIKPAPLVMTAGGPHVVQLASGLATGTHVVELYKRTEAQVGVTQFLGFDFHGGTLLSPPPRRTRRIEIVGDSDVTGFGYVGAVTGVCTPAPVWAARFENFRGAWGARLGEKLQAELHGTAFSGKGFYFNIWRPDTETIGVLYPRAEPTDPSSIWDMTSWIPDVVVVAIGGNDYNMGQPEDFGAAPLAGFTQKAREMTTMLRTAYPQAHLFLMAYAVLTDAWPPGRLRRTNVETALQTVRDERVASGDARVYYNAPPIYDPAELTGCDGHGGPAYHERIAAFLEADIRARTGWK